MLSEPYKYALFEWRQSIIPVKFYRNRQKWNLSVELCCESEDCHILLCDVLMLDLLNSKSYRCSDFSIQGQSWLKIVGDYRSFHRPYFVHYSVHIWHINVNWLYTRFNIDKMWPLMFLGEMLLFSWTNSLEAVQVHSVSYVLSMLASCRSYLDQTGAILHQLPFGNILLRKPLILNTQRHL